MEILPNIGSQTEIHIINRRHMNQTWLVIHGKFDDAAQMLNCGNVFDRNALASYSVAGVGGLNLGFSWIAPIIWPFVLRVYARCPNCGRTAWIKVLKPWSKS